MLTVYVCLVYVCVYICILLHLLFSTTLWYRDSHYPYFTKITCPKQILSKYWTLTLKQRNLILEYTLLIRGLSRIIMLTKIEIVSFIILNMNLLPHGVVNTCVTCELHRQGFIFRKFGKLIHVLTITYLILTVL